MSTGSFSDLAIIHQKRLTKLINTLVSEGKSWEKIRNLTDYSEDDDISSRFNSFIINNDLMDITGFSYDQWKNLVKEMEANSSPENAISFFDSDFIENDHSLISDTLQQPDGFTSWMAYAKHLKNDNHFSEETIDSIENSANEIIKRLSKYKSPVKGIVVGNVQSGKTANMAAVMSKCADLDTNLFIILTGNVTNLRIQTQDRISDDLRRPCDIKWINLLEELKKTDVSKPLEQRLDFSENSNERYYFCCLKNPIWIRKLIKIINVDLKQSKNRMKVLIIDDEADQGSLNGKDIRKGISPINGLIRDLVNNSNDKSNNYRNISYIGYTATPYGNFLNEKREDSLYPRDFICLLSPSPFYIGPDQLFGNNPLDIFNNITESDLASIDTLSDENIHDLPDSLKEAIAWFCDCLAIRRFYGEKKPTSMLIHNDRLTDEHSKIAESISKWFEELNSDDFILLCERVYLEQTKKLTASDFFDCIPLYGRYTYKDKTSVTIKDYPSFEDIKSAIKKLHETGLRHIKTITEKIEGKKKITNSYGEYIHLCIDNSVAEPVVKKDNSDEDIFYKENLHVRLVYPKNTEYSGGSPGFIVVGGNTLSRGITIEGLVSSYFARDVKTGDTLMQMGRWFGYRVGYELLPRVWITESAKTRFEALTEADHNIREFLKGYKTELSPATVAPVIQCPNIPDLRITSKNKSQTADFTKRILMGLHPQSITFSNNTNELERNKSAAEEFIAALNKNYTKNDKYKNRVIWKNVSKNYITSFLENYEAYFSGVGITKELIYIINTLPQINSAWNVVLSGISQGEMWIENIRKVNRSKKIPSKANIKENTFSIGSLAESKSWTFDFEEEIEEKRDTGGEDKNSQQASRIRHEKGVGNNPLMVLYCIDKQSKPKWKETNRLPLDAGSDVLGVEILLAANINLLINKEHDYLQMNME